MKHHRSAGCSLTPLLFALYLMGRDNIYSGGQGVNKVSAAYFYPRPPTQVNPGYSVSPVFTFILLFIVSIPILKMTIFGLIG